MAKRNTQQLIADAFTEIVKTTSLSQVRITDIIEKLNINRNTFYYYFASKYDVALWIFRKDLGIELRDSFSEHELVYSMTGEKTSCTKIEPYYAHVETGARTLDSSKFLKALVRCLLKKQTFYCKLFNPHELEFLECVTNLYYPAMRDDIAFILGGRYMPDETYQLLTMASCRYITMIAEFYLENEHAAQQLDNRINPFWNILHESLYDAIQSHPINRHNSHPRVSFTTPMAML